MKDLCLLRFGIRSGLLLLSASCCAGCGDRAIPFSAPQPWVSSFTLVDQSANLNVGQGYASGTATDGTPLNFFFDTQVLYRSSSYDTLEPVAVNYYFLPPGTSHMGAGDYYNGHVYAVIEHWQSCSLSSAPIFIATFNATTLAQESTIEITSFIPEASGIAIDPGRRPGHRQLLLRSPPPLPLPHCGLELQRHHSSPDPRRQYSGRQLPRRLRLHRRNQRRTLRSAPRR